MRNGFIHTQGEPEQVEVLVVLGVLSKGGKTLMLIIQTVTPYTHGATFIPVMQRLWESGKL